MAVLTEADTPSGDRSAMTGPRVLHVLPHPGGGGETYVDQLCRIPGYRFERVYLAPGTRPGPAVLAGTMRAQLAARDCDLRHVHGEVAAGLCLPSLAFGRSVVTINGLHLVRRLSGWQRRVAEMNLRLVARASSAIICVSESELADVDALLGSSARLFLVPNGVELGHPSPLERLQARADLGLRPTEVTGLYLAALDPHKEPLVAAHAALEVSNDGLSLVLLFAGDGPMRSTLDALAATNPALRVLGFQDEPYRALAAADFFVLPSSREGLSFSLLEAMSFGLPAVVSDAPGNQDAVADTGIVVPSGDVGAFAQAFRRLLDEETRAKLGNRGRERVATLFRADQMRDGTLEVYKSILD